MAELALERFTDRAKRVLVLAEEEAVSFKHNYIGTEHLLLGLLAEEEGIAAKILANLEVSLDPVREALTLAVGPGAGTGAEPRKLTPRAERAIKLAIAEAHRLKHDYVGTEHLLLSLLLEGEGVAAELLAKFGVTLPQVYGHLATTPAPGRRLLRAAIDVAVSRTRGRRAATTDPGETKGNVLTCRVTDRDLAAIDSLVEAGIRSTRSDAAAWLITAGIAANADLFAKIATTTEQIRQLRAEVQRLAQDQGITLFSE